MRGLAITAFGLLLASLPFGVSAQEKKAAAQSAPSTAAPAVTPAANPKDVQSLDAVVAAIYEVISGPPGARDWNRFQSLFAKDARLIAVRVAKEGKPTLAVMTPKDQTDASADLIGGDYLVRFEGRTLDDIRALGGNDEEDERAFATVARFCSRFASRASCG